MIWVDSNNVGIIEPQGGTLFLIPIKGTLTLSVPVLCRLTAEDQDYCT